MSHRKVLWFSFCILVLGAAADVVSSCLHFPLGFMESNPFARHADGSFYLWRAVVGKVWFSCYFSIVSACIYATLARWGRHLAAIWASVPLLWFGLYSLFACFHNVLMATGWYVPIALLGGR
jgi:hypothetical protein